MVYKGAKPRPHFFPTNWFNRCSITKLSHPITCYIFQPCVWKLLHFPCRPTYLITVVSTACKATLRAMASFEESRFVYVNVIRKLKCRLSCVSIKVHRFFLFFLLLRRLLWQRASGCLANFVEKLARYGREDNQSDTSDTLSFTGRNRELESLRLRQATGSRGRLKSQRLLSVSPLSIRF